MFARLLILFIVVPVLEVLVIIQIGSRIGYLYTILLLVVISVAGAALAKSQGLRAVAQIQQELRNARMPGGALIDGMLILAAALLLLTPGYLTDAAGLLLLVPPVRRAARKYVGRRLNRAVEQRRIRIFEAGEPGEPGWYGPGQSPEQRRRELGPHQ